MIKYIKSVLWRVAKCLSSIEEARCLRVKSLTRHTKTGKHKLGRLQQTCFKWVRDEGVYYNAPVLFQNNTPNGIMIIYNKIPPGQYSVPVIQTAGCTVVTLDNLFIVTCPVCVQEG